MGILQNVLINNLCFLNFALTIAAQQTTKLFAMQKSDKKARKLDSKLTKNY